MRAAFAARRVPGSYEPGKWAVSPYNRDPAVLGKAFPSQYPERTILRETALLMRHVGTTLAGNFSLFVLLHAGEPAQRSSALALVLLSHAVTSCLVVIRPESAKSTDWQRLGFPHFPQRGMR